MINRPSCRDIFIIDKTSSGFDLFQASGAVGAGGDIPSYLRDLHKDGKFELLLRSTLSQFPNRCLATWTAVYAWTGSNYTNVSHQFEDFYRERLNSLNTIIPSLQTGRGPKGYGLRDKECLEAEKGAIQRFLGVSPDAGIDQAIRMATSNDASERDFAIGLLVEIGTPKAREYLNKLTKDSNPSVAWDAKTWLPYLTSGAKLGGESFEHAGSVRY